MEVENHLSTSMLVPGGVDAGIRSTIFHQDAGVDDAIDQIRNPEHMGLVMVMSKKRGGNWARDSLSELQESPGCALF